MSGDWATSATDEVMGAGSGSGSLRRARGWMSSSSVRPSACACASSSPVAPMIPTARMVCRRSRLISRVSSNSGAVPSAVSAVTLINTGAFVKRSPALVTRTARSASITASLAVRKIRDRPWIVALLMSKGDVVLRLIRCGNDSGCWSIGLVGARPARCASTCLRRWMCAGIEASVINCNPCVLSAHGIIGDERLQIARTGATVGNRLVGPCFNAQAMRLAAGSRPPGRRPP